MSRLRPVLFAMTASSMIAAGGCAKLTLAWADLDAAGPSASPPLLADDATLADWESSGAPAARRALQENVYGYLPDRSPPAAVERRVLNAAAFGGKGRLEELRIKAVAVYGDEAVPVESAQAGEGFIVNVVFPTAAPEPVPVIVMQTFCPRWDTLPDASIVRPDDAWSCEDDGLMSGVMTYVFGRYIATPPVEDILDAGFAIAAIFPDEAVPDSRDAGRAALARLSAGHADDETRWGAIAAWAWIFSRTIDALEQDPRLDRDAMIVFGHSRYAKSALVAAAFDTRIDGVVAHQSGTGGASLNADKRGETVGEITRAYPHWFARRYASSAGREAQMPVDQHHLLALIAPRPVLLGNARRDVWSDPAGAFRAARVADAVYELYGATGLTAERLDQFDPSATLSVWMRPGTHGVVKEDWPAFLRFLRAHFLGSAAEKS